MPRRSAARKRQMKATLDKRTKKRNLGVRSKNRKSVVPRGITTMPGQYCKIVETINLVDLQPNTNYLHTFQLNQFRRAHYMSAAFAFYRAAKVTYVYQPIYNTFTDVSGSSTVPYIYTLMNRQGDTNLPQSNMDVVLATGARPKRFNSNHVVSYKPNWTTPGMPTQTVASGGSGLTVSPFIQGSQTCYNWINKSSKGQKVYPPGAGGNDSGVLTGIPPDNSTFPGIAFVALGSACDGVAYLGHDAYIDQAKDLNPAACARVILTVEWEFKGPIWNNLIRQDIITL